MKKIYQTPATDLLLADLEELLAASFIEGFNLDDVPETEEVSGNLSHQNVNVWGDDEE